MTHIHYLSFPKINPVIFSLGPISLRWYGVMYLIGFFFTMYAVVYRKYQYYNSWNKEEIKNILYLIFLCILLGGRIGYIVFYNCPLLFKDPFFLFRIWEGGMSFHGGLIGAILAMLFLSRNRINFFYISDLIVPSIPFGLGMGRIGNFINEELWGRVSVNLPWAMLFTNSQNEDYIFLLSHPKFYDIFNRYHALPRHPSQIYEFFLEGMVLFIILNIFTKKSLPLGSISGLFLFFYGIFRFFVEFFRQPDIQIGLIANVISMGQILSIPMVIFGIIIVIWSYYYSNKNILFL